MSRHAVEKQFLWFFIKFSCAAFLNSQMDILAHVHLGRSAMSTFNIASFRFTMHFLKLMQNIFMALIKFTLHRLEVIQENYIGTFI